MKILVLNYEWPPLGGGGGPVAEGLARDMARAGHEVHVITSRYRGQQAHEEREGVRLHRVRCWRRRMETCETPEMISFVLAAYRPTLGFIRRERPDVIHCHFAVPTGLLAWLVHRKTGVPYVLTCHGSDIPGHNPKRFKLGHRFTPPILRNVLGNAVRVVAPSHFFADHIREGYGAEVGDRLSVIPNGVDVGRFAEVPKADPPVVMMGGRLLPFKGFIETLKALRGVPGEYEVSIAGDGPCRDEMERLASALPQKVTFHGWIDHESPELTRLYERAGIFSMPSSRENAPVSLLEAMAARMAVVTADASGCKETVGEAGVLVPAGDIEALRKSLALLIEDAGKREVLARKARRRVEEEFDAELAAPRYLELLQGVRRASAAV